MSGNVHGPPGWGALEAAGASRLSVAPPLRFVCVGGGTGLPAVLEGLAGVARSGPEAGGLSLTAIVAMSDNGGSSGGLRRSRGVLPPGDIRNCLVALAEGPEAVRSLFQYRFAGARGLAGHTVGNLFIAALAELRGDFLEAVRVSARLLGTRGRVLPSTLAPVHLAARMVDGSVVVGEQDIVHSGRRVARVSLTPAAPPPAPGVLEAIARADVIVLGPGSLYSSLLPNLLVDGVAGALARSRALKVLVANLMTQPGETDGMSGDAHLQALVDHAGPVVDVVLLNDAAPPPRVLRRYADQGSVPLSVTSGALARLGLRSMEAALLAPGELIRHAPASVARCLLRLARAHLAGR